MATAWMSSGRPGGSPRLLRCSSRRFWAPTRAGRRRSPPAPPPSWQSHFPRMRSPAWCASWSVRPRAERREHGYDARFSLALEHIGEAQEEVEHPRVISQHVSNEAMNAARLGGLEEIAEQRGADASILPAVLNDEGDLRRVLPVGGLVARHRDQLARLLLHDQRQPPAIVHVGQKVG